MQEYYISQGYQSLSKGWPDFVFYKKRPGQKTEYLFIEVKRPNQNTIKAWQRRIKNVFEDLGLDYFVCFGLNSEGKPDFKQLPGLNNKKRTTPRK